MRFLDLFKRNSKSRQAVQPRYVRARYDAAQTDRLNSRHFEMADALSAVAANSQEVRSTLRERSRYEVSNNSYLRGIIDTRAAYTVGQGPGLQLLWMGDPDQAEAMRAAAQQVERLFGTWAKARKLAPKLAAMWQAKDIDGEAFAMKIAGKPSPYTPISLDLRLYECDYFDIPSIGSWPDEDVADSGVLLGSDGEPLQYAMQQSHPGSNQGIQTEVRFRWVPADSLLHMFRMDRPGQLRGIPVTVPALTLMPILRRYTLAAVTAAESAADVAAVVTRDYLPGTDATDYEGGETDPGQTFEFHRGMMMELPEGSDISQIKAEQPTTTYEMFATQLVKECARPMGVPAVLALGDGSNYNYASGRLDLQGYSRVMGVDRANMLEAQVLDPLWAEWVDEALLRPDFLPPEFSDNAGEFLVNWMWPEPEHVDRQKEAAGQKQELENNTTTLAREYARKGLDWQSQLEQRAREKQFAEEIGLSGQQQTEEPQAEEEGAPEPEQSGDEAGGDSDDTGTGGDGGGPGSEAANDSD